MVLKLVFGVSCALEGNAFSRTPENTSIHPQGKEHNDEETLLCFSDSQGHGERSRSKMSADGTAC